MRLPLSDSQSGQQTGVKTPFLGVVARAIAPFTHYKQMTPSKSKIAKSINDQYYTSVECAEWCLNHVSSVVGWNLEGVALEPCVGRGAFVLASRNLGLKLQWVTNDLFPDPSFTPDTQEHILQLSTNPRPDFILTNPPFGNANSLARTSLKHCLEICGRVAMVLPKGARRVGFLDAQPDYAHLIEDINIPDMSYQLPNGEVRKVQTCLQVWEVQGTKREKIKAGLDLREDLLCQWDGGRENFEFCGGPAQFQVCRWGGKRMNSIRQEIKRSGSWMSVRITHPTASVEEVVKLIQSVDVTDYLERSTSLAAFDVPVWVDRVNRKAVEAGLLPALEGKTRLKRY